jgi:uncharacterized protein
VAPGAVRRREVPRRERRDGRRHESRPLPRGRVPRLATLVDTSALYALLAATDSKHHIAARALSSLHAQRLVTHDYLVLETTALVQRRLPAAAVRALHERLLGPIDVVWIEEDLHRAAVGALLAAGGRRRVSFVDWVSFEVMRRHGIETAFAFDRNFRTQGFRIIP